MFAVISRSQKVDAQYQNGPGNKERSYEKDSENYKSIGYVVVKLFACSYGKTNKYTIIYKIYRM